jgi:hypothetical protein
MTLKDALTDRVAKAQKARDEFAAQSSARLAQMDQRLAVLTDLLAQWDTLTIDQAETRAAQAGLRVRVDA